MKILRISFTSYPGFTGHTVVFEDRNLPPMSFLVGNNGSGKTRVIEAIFNSFINMAELPNPSEIEYTIRLTQNEMQALNTQVDTILYRITRTEGANYRFTDINGKLIEGNINDFSKIVYSSIEVNFEQRGVTAITAKNIDEAESPRERSANLSNEIPQLLVDIKSLDDADKATFIDQHVGQSLTVPDNIGNRLRRFTDAFHTIYGGSKTFVEIRNQDGQKHLVFKDEANNEVFLRDMSTGEKQIIYRVGYLLKNIGNISGAIILIDEPEISLHPTWQLKLKDFLHDVFQGRDVQFIIATHSPFIFENLDENREVCIKVDRTQTESRKIALSFPGLPSVRTSVSLISYLAFGVYDIGLHIELYTFLQIRQNLPHITGHRGIETWLRDPQGGNMPEWQNFISGQTTYSESIMTWIRNKIHHGDNPDRPNFTKAELKESIDAMIQLLR